jgi:hypothetical protein
VESMPLDLDYQRAAEAALAAEPRRTGRRARR